jgi:hypothetical protein
VEKRRGRLDCRLDCCEAAAGLVEAVDDQNWMKGLSVHLCARCEILQGRQGETYISIG